MSKYGKLRGKRDFYKRKRVGEGKSWTNRLMKEMEAKKEEQDAAEESESERN